MSVHPEANDAYHARRGLAADDSSLSTGSLSRYRARRSAEMAVADPALVHATAGDFLGDSLEELLRLVRENAEWFIETHDEEALHQLRISVRKVRALSTFLYPLARADKTIETANDRLRELAAPFGEVRDLDVLVIAIDRDEAPVTPGQQAALRASLVKRRAAAAAESESHLGSRKWRREMDRLARAAFDGEWRRSVGARDLATLVVGHELDSWWWKITARWRELDEIDDHRRHRVRIAAKKLRYLTELTAPLYADRESAQVRASRQFKAMQDHLGELQDAVAAAELIRAHGFKPTEPDPFTMSASMLRAVETRNELERTGPYWR